MLWGVNNFSKTDIIPKISPCCTLCCFAVHCSDPRFYRPREAPRVALIGMSSEQELQAPIKFG